MSHALNSFGIIDLSPNKSLFLFITRELLQGKHFLTCFPIDTVRQVLCQGQLYRLSLTDLVLSRQVTEAVEYVWALKRIIV